MNDKQLENRLSLAVKQTANTVSQSFGEILESIDKIFNQDNLKQKSRLTKRNIKAMQQLKAVNHFIEEKFGEKYTISVMDILADERIEASISENGKSREELIKFAEALATRIRDEQELSMMEKGFGK